MTSAPSAPVAELRSALLAHYDAHRRRLPWRDETDPYRILVSEVMLQQTRVETVLDYYEPWLDRFPDMASLAAADLDDVLEAWAGLGYYRRARNLHGAARLLRERPDASLPSSYAELRELPGVGDYTAGAVASIAFGEVVPAVDGNVRRVLARLFDVAHPKAPWLRATAAELVDPDRPGDWTQALMELGATVCIPRAPRCEACPVAGWCLARERGTEREPRAVVKRRGARRVLFAVAVVHSAGRVLLVKRSAEGLLGGMWSLPESEVAAEDEAAAAVVAVAEEVGVTVQRPADRLSAGEHRFTHLRATYLPFVIEAVDAPTSPATESVTWADLEEPAGVALPAAQRRIIESARAHLAVGAG